MTLLKYTLKKCTKTSKIKWIVKIEVKKLLFDYWKNFKKTILTKLKGQNNDLYKKIMNN